MISISTLLISLFPLFVFFPCFHCLLVALVSLNLTITVLLLYYSSGLYLASTVYQNPINYISCNSLVSIVKFYRILNSFLSVNPLHILFSPTEISLHTQALLASLFDLNVAGMHATEFSIEVQSFLLFYPSLMYQPLSVISFLYSLSHNRKL